VCSCENNCIGKTQAVVACPKLGRPLGDSLGGGHDNDAHRGAAAAHPLGRMKLLAAFGCPRARYADKVERWSDGHRSLHHI
jgi:hypothetical protein